MMTVDVYIIVIYDVITVDCCKCILLYIFNGRICFIKEKSTKKIHTKTLMNIRLNIPKGIQKYIHYVHADMLTS